MTINQGSSFRIELASYKILSVEGLNRCDVDFFTEKGKKVTKTLDDIFGEGDNLYVYLTSEDTKSLAEGVLYYTMSFDGVWGYVTFSDSVTIQTTFYIKGEFKPQPSPVPSEEIEELKRQVAELKATIDDFKRVVELGKNLRGDDLISIHCDALFDGKYVTLSDDEHTKLYCDDIICDDIDAEGDIRAEEYYRYNQNIENRYAKLEGAAFTGNITVEGSAQFNNSIDVANPELFTIGPDPIDSRYVLRDEMTLNRNTNNKIE